MAANLQQLERALVNADAAGDGEAARMLAAEIKRLRPAPQKSAAQDTGAGEAFVVGAGRMGDRLYEGLKQAGMGIGGIFSEALPQGMKQTAQDAIGKRLMAQEATQKENTAAYEPLQKERPYSTLAGEIAAIAPAPMLRPLSGVGTLPTVLNAAVTGAAPGLLEYGSAQERGQRGAMGAAGGTVGAGIGVGAGRLANPVRPQLSQSQQAAQQAAERLGLNLSAGEQTGSKAIKWAEGALADLPFSAGMEQARQKGNEALIGKAASRSIGQTAEEVTPDVLSNARKAIGSQFDNLLANRRVPLDNSFQAEVKSITGSKVIKELRDDSVEAILAPFRNLPPGKISVTGDWFQQNKTALDSAIRTAYTAGENGKARALEGFERALDRAVGRSMTTTEKAAYESAQKQWASLRLLETGQVVKDGRVMPAALDSALKNRYKSAYREGNITGDLPDIASMASMLRPPPNSGTAPRGIYSGMAGGVAFAEPMTGAAMLATPPILQGLMQSNIGKRYLSQGLLGVTPELEQLMMRAGGGLLGGAAVARD